MKKKKDQPDLKRPEYSMLLGMIQGAIGKEYVIKHYGNRIVLSRYPDMTKIKASKKQNACRDLFREAVADSKKLIADPEQKAALQKKIRRGNGSYNEAIKIYMLKEKKEKERAMRQTESLLNDTFIKTDEEVRTTDSLNTLLLSKEKLARSKKNILCIYT